MAVALSPTSRIIIKEAKKRKIAVKVLVAEKGYFTLTHKKKMVHCCSSLTELASVVSAESCLDKRFGNIMLKKAGIRVPHQILAGEPEKNAKFFKKHKRVVTKPLSESLGRGVSVDIRSLAEMEKTIDLLKINGDEHVLIEEFCQGLYVRMLVIDHKFVAAVHHALPSVTGNGKHIIEQLIVEANLKADPEKQIPLNFETARCVKQAGYKMTQILPEGVTIAVRKNSNEHTGATPIDVTDTISSSLKKTAEKISRVLDIPVVGIDFLVPDIQGEDYVIVEANSRPAFDGHGNQPIAERFIDYLFPATIK